MSAMELVVRCWQWFLRHVSLDKNNKWELERNRYELELLNTASNFLSTRFLCM